MKIAIDVRKWRDYGIGTYVRNLVRHLAKLDPETSYLLFCNPADEATLRDLAENFVPVVDHSARYGIREHFSIPLKLRRLGAQLLHSPHYVRPLLCTIPSVVTIHDCIHLLFPQYLPNRMAFRYARFVMGSAVRRSALVFTVSEASRADILRFYPATDPEKVLVVPNAIDAELLVDPGEEERERVRERYQIRGRFVLFAGNVKPHKNLERLIRAFARVRAQPGHEDLRLVLLGEDVSRYGSLRRDRRGVRGCGRTCASSASSRTARWPRSTAWPPSSPSRRSTRGSGCPRSRRWPAGRRSSPRASPRCPRSSATGRCSSTPTAKRRSRTGSRACSTISSCGADSSSADCCAPRSSAGIARCARSTPAT